MISKPKIKIKTKIKTKSRPRGIHKSTSTLKKNKPSPLPILTKMPVLSLEGCPCLGCPFNESGNDKCLGYGYSTECSLIEDWVLDSYSD